MKHAIVYIIDGHHHLHSATLRVFIELHKKQNVDILLYSQRFHPLDIKKKDIIKKIGIYMQEFQNTEQLTKYITHKNKQYLIDFINTSRDDLILYVNFLRKEIGQNVSDDVDLLKNKTKQREAINKYASEYSVISQEYILKNISYKQICKNVGAPFIVKPTHGVESSGVELINTESQFKKYLKHRDSGDAYLIEEYLEGDLYIINYYINQKGEISYSPPLLGNIGKSININDFCLYLVGTPRIIQNKLDHEKIEKFISKSIIACGIRNTFICHEFIHVGNNVFRTIELNGRIGGRSIENCFESYSLNIYSLLYKQYKITDHAIKNYTASFKIYPQKTGVLKRYNTGLLHKIKELPSCTYIETDPIRYENQKIGLTGDGYWQIGRIFLKNSNKNILLQDSQFIEENYKDLLIMQ